jgi:hypothetical protein
MWGGVFNEKKCFAKNFARKTIGSNQQLTSLVKK